MLVDVDVDLSGQLPPHCQPLPLPLPQTNLYQLRRRRVVFYDCPFLTMNKNYYSVARFGGCNLIKMMSRRPASWRSAP